MNYKVFLWLLPALSGIFLIFSSPPFSLPLLPFLSLLPLFFFLSLKDISLKKALLAGFLTGFIFFSQVMIWSFSSYPLNWLLIENKGLSFFLVMLAWLLSVGCLAIFLGLFALSYRKFKKNSWLNLLLVPSLWIIFEYLRAWAFGIFFAGEEALFGAHWTFGNLAYSLAQNFNFRFLAGIGGIYLVSFLIVLINVLFFLLMRKSKKISSLLIILIIVSLICFSYFFSFSKIPEETSQNLKVAIIQTKFFSPFSWVEEIDRERFQVQADLVRDAFRLSPNLDIIVFPENNEFLSRQEAKTVLAEFPQKDFLVIDSSQIYASGGVKSMAVLYSLQKGSLAQYEKLLLAPVGEYLPYIFKWPAQIINQKWTEEFASSRDHKKGQGMIVLSDQNSFQGGALFCSEALSPVLYRQATQQDAQVLFNLSSLAFSSGSKHLDAQAQAMLQFRAVENSRYLVRSTNFGHSYIINQRGEIIQKTPNMDKQVLLGEVRPLVQETFYTKFGDWILILAGLMALIFLLVRVKLRKE